MEADGEVKNYLESDDLYNDDEACYDKLIGINILKKWLNNKSENNSNKISSKECTRQERVWSFQTTCMYITKICWWDKIRSV